LNELTGQTYALRTKEDAQDYRYMPDPNLPAMAIEPVSARMVSEADFADVSKTYIEHLKSSLPELPGQTVHRLIEQYGVPKKEVETLIGLDEYHFQGVAYFEQVSQGDNDLGKRALNL
jgi:aspartyl-tRNA(Asn)/glutamyl-tRNA(Gln) amidotransferase subunit B